MGIYLSAIQEHVGQDNVIPGPAHNPQGQQGVGVSVDRVSLVIDGSIGIIDVVGAIDRISQEIRSIGSRIDGIEGSLRSLKDGVDQIPGIRQEIESIRASIRSASNDIEAVRKDASISRLVGVVGLWKLSLCSNNRAGVCYAWRLGDNIYELTAIYGDQAVVEVDGARRVRVSIAYHLCGICPLFRPRTS